MFAHGTNVRWMHNSTLPKTANDLHSNETKFYIFLFQHLTLNASRHATPLSIAIGKQKRLMIRARSNAKISLTKNGPTLQWAADERALVALLRHVINWPSIGLICMSNKHYEYEISYLFWVSCFIFHHRRRWHSPFEMCAERTFWCTHCKAENTQLMGAMINGALYFWLIYWN